MTVDEFAGNREEYINGNITHEEYYKNIINKLGYENVKKYIPFSLEVVKNSKNKYFNDLKLARWDSGAFAIKELYRKNGINCSSLSDGVCILKQAARMWLKEGK